MTTTAKWIGRGTLQVTASGLTTTFAELTNAVADAITGTQPAAVGALSGLTFTADAGVTALASTGWTLHDSSTSGIIFTQVFKSLNLDGVTYKNMILRWNKITNELDTSTCESWNETNHTPLNECFTYFNCATLGYKLSQFDLVIIVNPHLLCLHNYIGSDVGLWAGVFENMREDANDTAENGYPCWGWMSSTLMCLGADTYNLRPSLVTDNPLICMPRTRDGSTGIAAARSWSADYGLFQHPQWLSATPAGLPYYLGVGGKFVTSGWDTSKREVLPIKPIHNYAGATPANYGQLMGVKMVSNAGADMSKIQVLVDADNNFSNAGVLRDHWLLNNHHRNTTAVAASWFANTSPTIAKTDYTVDSGLRPEYMCSTGAAWYVVTSGATGNKLVRIDATTGASTVIATAGAGTFFDLRYDGERYVYYGTNTGLRRLDTQTDTLATEVAVATGVQTMSITQTHVVCASSTASATPTVTRILRSTNAIDGSNGSQVLATFTDSIKIMDAITDYDGNVLMVAALPTTAAGFKVVRVSPAGVISYIVMNQLVCASVGLVQTDANTVLLYQHLSGGVIYQTQFNPKTLAIGTTLSCTSAATLTAQSKATQAKIQGLIMNLGKGSATTGYAARLPLGATSTLILATPTISENLASTLTAASANQFIYTDGCRVFSNTDTGLRVFTGMQAGASLGTAGTLGQFAVVA